MAGWEFSGCWDGKILLDNITIMFFSLLLKMKINSFFMVLVHKLHGVLESSSALNFIKYVNELINSLLIKSLG